MTLEEKRKRDNDNHKKARAEKKRPHACNSCGEIFIRYGVKQKFCSKTCYLAAHKHYKDKWRKKQPKGYDAKYRIAYRCKRAGTTPEEYKKFWDEQNGLCAICHVNPIRDIDHSHVTGKARGLLCGKCNMALGLFQDSAEIIFEAALYLERTEAK